MFQEWIDQFIITWRLLKDPRVPWTAKLVPVLLVVYIASPLDLIPDFLPVIGQIDDVAILLLGMQLFERVSPAHIVEEHRAALHKRA
jgi:uncharacterized membrane protein YkvA (DUF1232 family)